MTATAGRLTGLGLVGLLALTGCGNPDDAGSSGNGPPTVTVQVGDQQVDLDPTQYCLGGDGQRYDTSPPIVEAVADSPITLTVPAAVADAGWSVQVFDEKLAEKIGEVEVDADTTVFDGINTSDVVPPTYYLVVVEDSDPDACDGLSGAWPVGFIRAVATADTTTPTAAPTAG